MHECGTPSEAPPLPILALGRTSYDDLEPPYPIQASVHHHAESPSPNNNPQESACPECQYREIPLTNMLNLDMNNSESTDFVPNDRELLPRIALISQHLLYKIQTVPCELFPIKTFLIIPPVILLMLCVTLPHMAASPLLHQSEKYQKNIFRTPPPP